MNSKYWSKYIVYTTILLLLTTILFNFLINPFGIFKIDHQLNKVKNHFINSKTTKFYYAKREDINVLMIGTSRIEKLNPEDLKPYVSGKIYNIALPASNVAEQYQALNYFINNNKINTVILGIDFFSYFPQNNIKSLEKKYKTQYSELHYKDYIDSLLSSDALISSFKTLRDNIKGGIKPNYNFSNGWHIPHEKSKEKAVKRFNKALNNYKKIYENIILIKPNSFNEQISYLKKIIILCKSKNIDLKVYVSPIHFEQYNLIFTLKLYDIYFYWLKEISKLTDFYNFSGKNIITINSDNYLDSSHFKPLVGKLIFKRLFEKNNNENNFGVFVTDKTIDKHIKQLSAENGK